MRDFTDYRGKKIRLTDERWAHIKDHPEMKGLKKAIEETLLNPECVVKSLSDDTANLYYRFYSHSRLGGKYLCVVVKVKDDDAFILTAYLTDKIKKGEILWVAKT